MSEQKKPQAGDGFRLLKAGELIVDGDECHRPDLKEGPWIAIRSEMGRHYNEYDHYPIRRKLDATANNASVAVHTGGPYVVVEAYRAALAEIERLESQSNELLETLESRYEIIAERDAQIDRLNAELEAVKQLLPEPEPEWFDLTALDGHVLREEIDLYEKDNDNVWLPIRVYSGATIGSMKEIWGHFQKFRCLLKDAPKTATPPEDAYGRCPICGVRGKSRERRINGNDACENGHIYPSNDAIYGDAIPASKDPDEWVTQDRVPYRKGVDEFRWMRVFGTPFSEWSNMETNPRMHGYIDGLNSRFEVRCRRRDLPPTPEPKPATQTIVFHERIVPVDETGNRYLVWSEHPETSDEIVTGRTSGNREGRGKSRTWDGGST